MSEQRTHTGPLVGSGSKAFGVIAVLALAFGGVAGMVGGGTSSPSAELASSLSAAQASTSDGPDQAPGSDGHGHGHGDDHVHGDDAAHGDDHGHGEGHGGDAAHPAGHDATGHDGAGHSHGTGPRGGAGSAGSDPGATVAAAGDHDHAAGHDDGGEHASGSHGSHAGHDAGTADGAGGADHGDHGSGSGAGHDEHDDAGHADAHHDHYAGCADDHPVTVALRSEVQRALDSVYKDVVALVALGFHPYFDSLVPGGYPPGGEGISHWLNPNHIDNGNVLDPWKPEAILLDEWNNPIGMMFINDAGVAPTPVYVDDDGTVCSPWHPHTDMPARFGWYYYRAVYDREMGGDIPEQTPEMMHVWALDNPAGVYAAHDYPPSENRQGPPGPLPSYLSDGAVADLVRQIFGR